MIGTVEVERIPIRCIVGIHPFERVQEQDIAIDVSMDLDFAEASVTERVGATVDYTAVAKAVTDLVMERKYQLIETMAEECARLVLSEWPRVESTTIVVHKPAAVPEAVDTRVKVVRRRNP